MKVMTVLGTRPEIIRLSQIVPLLDELTDHVVVHTGQNFDPNLSDIFFKELGLREPDIYLGVRAESFGEQVGQLLERIEPVIRAEMPERMLILGDTNSGLVSIVARRLGVPVFHMEAGNRSYDDRVPEEVNRRIIDHCSSVLLPYTHRSKENLVREGIDRSAIFVTGNPIKEVLDAYSPHIAESDVVGRLGLERSGFFLATLHRAETVDDEQSLAALAESLALLSKMAPLVVSLHPRTGARLDHAGIDIRSSDVIVTEPLGFFDFVALEKAARCIVTDSGTVQEEAAILQVRSVTIRRTTERPETLEAGSNVLAGVRPTDVTDLVVAVESMPVDWVVPAEYLVSNVSAVVTRLLLSPSGRDV
jgi:UDP-N-acetylglucosamine 2-epimerase (non-hydrolysing)